MPRLFLIFIIILIAIIAIVTIIVISSCFVLFIILLEVCVHFIDCIVGQVNVHVINIRSSRLLVGLGSEPSKSLLVNEYSQWIQTV